MMVTIGLMMMYKHAFTSHEVKGCVTIDVSLSYLRLLLLLCLLNCRSLKRMLCPQSIVNNILCS